MIAALIAFALLAPAPSAEAPSAEAPSAEAPLTQAPAERTRLGPSGLPVPRFVSLKSNEVNARQGPSSAHRVLWVYRRAGLPLRITAESGNWRRIEDVDGDRAWVHVGTLSAQRTALVTTDRAPLLASAKPKSRVRAWLKTGVVATLLDCKTGWRKLRVGGRTGWTSSAQVWGTPSCENIPLA